MTIILPRTPSLSKEINPVGMNFSRAIPFILLLIGDTDVGRLVTYMEMEFEGNQSTPILRQAFIKFKGSTIGKTWSTFCDIAAGPATIDEEGPSSEVALRQPQIRYTYDFTDNLKHPWPWNTWSHPTRKENLPSTSTNGFLTSR
ncbi:MAG: porin [Butyricimonas faecalis]